MDAEDGWLDEWMQRIGGWIDECVNEFMVRGWMRVEVNGWLSYWMSYRILTILCTDDSSMVIMRW